jgi:hypothetical protein
LLGLVCEFVTGDVSDPTQHGWGRFCSSPRSRRFEGTGEFPPTDEQVGTCIAAKAKGLGLACSPFSRTSGRNTGSARSKEGFRRGEGPVVRPGWQGARGVTGHQRHPRMPFRRSFPSGEERLGLLPETHSLGANPPRKTPAFSAMKSGQEQDRRAHPRFFPLRPRGSKGVHRKSSLESQNGQSLAQISPYRENEKPVVDIRVAEAPPASSHGIAVYRGLMLGSRLPVDLGRADYAG